MLLNYHIGRFVLSSLCVGDLVRLVLGGVRVAGFSLRDCCDIYCYCRTVHLLVITQNNKRCILNVLK